MSINQQPQVRSGSLPSHVPQNVANRQPIRQPAAAVSAEPADAEGAGFTESVEGAQAADKPRRKYTRKPKPKVDGGFALTRDEEAAWGRIALKALKAGVSPERYMQSVMGEHGAEIAVYLKLTGAQAQAAEGQAAEGQEPPVEA